MVKVSRSDKYYRPATKRNRQADTRCQKNRRCIAVSCTWIYVAFCIIGRARYVSIVSTPAAIVTVAQPRQSHFAAYMLWSRSPVCNINLRNPGNGETAFCLDEILASDIDWALSIVRSLIVVNFYYWIYLSELLLFNPLWFLTLFEFSIHCFGIWKYFHNFDEINSNRENRCISTLCNPVILESNCANCPFSYGFR